MPTKAKAQDVEQVTAEVVTLEDTLQNRITELESTAEERHKAYREAEESHKKAQVSLVGNPEDETAQAKAKVAEATLENAKASLEEVNSQLESLRELQEATTSMQETLGTLQDTITGIAERVSQGEIPVSWFGEVRNATEEFTGHLEGIPHLLDNRETVESLNWKSYLQSSLFPKGTVEAMKALDKPESEINEIIQTIYRNQYEKPFEGNPTDAVPLRDLHINLSMSVEEEPLAPSKPSKGRTSNGDSARREKRAKDLKHPEKSDKVYYETLWEAYQEDGEFKDLIPEETRGKLFYQGKPNGSQFIQSLEMKGKIEKARGYLQDWASKQKLKDGTPRFRFWNPADETP